jgi:hypothetical protein
MLACSLFRSLHLRVILERSEESRLLELPRPTWGEADARPRAAGEGPNFARDGLT